MAEFKEITLNCCAEEWDKELSGFRDYNYQQSFSFGELDSAQSSDPFRAVLMDGKQVRVMAQGRVRKLALGLTILVIRGGPLYQFSEKEKTNLKHLREFLAALIKMFRERYRFAYINITLNEERSVMTEIALREVGMTRPFFERAPYLTYMVPIYKKTDQNMQAFESKWRNQLRRAESLNPSFEWGNGDRLLKSYLALHNTMCQLKSIQSYSLTYESLLAMRDHLGEGFQFMIGKHQNQDVCGCGIIIFRDKAFYFYAAANEEGRNGYFSNAMVWHLIQKLQELNVTQLDMSGIDPLNNWGGYHFKKGAGGRPYAYMGEWDYSSSGILKPLINFALYRRSRSLYC